MPFALTAQAAAGAGACSPDQNKPRSVQNSTLALVRMSAATKPEERGRLLSTVVKEVSNEKSSDNQAGQAYMMAQALTQWAAEPGMGGVVQRSMLGYTTDPSATIDVFLAADSALKRLVAADPKCADLAMQLRQNQAWLNQVNGAINSLNAGKADSAEYYATRSLIMYQNSPYAYHVLSVVAQNKDDNAAATRYWQRLIETAGSDTTYRDIKNNAMYNIAATKAQAAQNASGEQQKALAKEAAAAFQAVIAAVPAGDAMAARAQPVLAQLLQMSGDVAAVAATYADQLANPSKYNDLTLTQSGVIASQSGKTEDAIRLTEAAIAQNPYQRDGLNNLSSMYLQGKQYEKLIPIARRLIDVDPSNGDNYAFMSLAYNGMANAAAAGAKKALNDSAFKYYQKSETMPVKVTFTEFTRGESRAVIGMQIEGVATTPPPAPAAPARAGARPAAKPAAAASAAPKTYTVTLEFLDTNGNVVDSQTQTVGPIGAGDKKQARFESAKAGIVAFRYAPLS